MPDVLVVNSTGELSSLYKRVTLAFVGKSLRGHGGQNFIEAAPVGTPIIVGPNMQNFRVITREFIRRHAIVQVTDEFELAYRSVSFARRTKSGANSVPAPARHLKPIWGPASAPPAPSSSRSMTSRTKISLPSS